MCIKKRGDYFMSTMIQERFETTRPVDEELSFDIGTRVLEMADNDGVDLTDVLVNSVPPLGSEVVQAFNSSIALSADMFQTSVTKA